MIIRPATIMRNDYNLISEYAHQSGEIVYLTKYGKGDLVVMNSVKKSLSSIILLCRQI